MLLFVSPIWNNFLSHNFWHRTFFLNEIFYLIMFFSSVSLFSLINLSNFPEEVTSPPTSIIFSVKYSFSSITFCSFSYFSNFSFSILSILKVRISSFSFLYFLILSCLFFLAMSTSFSRSSLNLELNQSLVLLLVNIISLQAEIVDKVGFWFSFWWNWEKSLSETMFVEEQFFRSSLTDCEDYDTSHLAAGLLVGKWSLTHMCRSTSGFSVSWKSFLYISSFVRRESRKIFYSVVRKD